MQRDADAHARRFLLPQPFEKAQIPVDIVAETALTLRQRAPVEAAGHVERRQQRETDARFVGRFDQRERHRGRIVVRRAIGLVMQIVELADLRVARLEHLDVELRCDRLEIVGPDAAGERVHHLAPRPEAVVGVRLALGEAGHRTLERVRMQVREARQHVAAERALALLAARHADQLAAVDADRDIGREPFGQPCVLCRKRSRRHRRFPSRKDGA